jgi:membrane protease YdiL (CAAX protease family)
VILSVACSIYCAIKIRSLIRIYSAISFILFGVVAIAFLFAVIHLGWEEAVLKDGFDISYFSFVLPFLLISLDLSKSKRIAQNNRVFSFAKKEPK